LHDGAVILRAGRVAAASCMLPLSESTMSYAIGTRHRAALGISERTDALAIVVSEETGQIAIASNGRLVRPITPEGLLAVLKGARPEGQIAVTGVEATASALLADRQPADGATV
jgi:diadenylate cyclase